MSVPTVQATFAATLVDEWVGNGVEAAVVCPGSRSTPLALALAARPELALHVRLDERGAGFFALGLAAASGRPVVVCTTSGTAAAELHPAVVEAHHAGVPLLVCTADRPPELHHVGAPQTIEQQQLYGPAVRWAVDPGVAVAEAAGTWRALARRAVAESCAGPAGPGPVHLNLPFRDPLVGEPGPLPPPVPAVAPGTGPDRPGGVVRGSRPPSAESVEALCSLAPGRGVVVAGDGCGSRDEVLGLAETLGWPVLADPRSGCRTEHPVVVAGADAFLRDAVVADALRPESVLLLGAPWASKVLAGWLADAAGDGAAVLAVDQWWRWRDPDRTVGVVLAEEPGPLLGAARHALAASDGPTAPAGWLGRWRSIESATQGAIDDALRAEVKRRDGALCEPAIGRLLLGLVPQGSRVVVASSMPVRELEWFAPPMAQPPQVMANRGANGIDGVCSTALGAAAAGRPVVALVGDLAFLHDVSALVRRSGSTPAAPAGSTPAAPAGCTVVVMDNRGGGIFSFLPQAKEVEGGRFETLFGTPQLPDVAEVARGFGLEVADVQTAPELERALGRLAGRSELAVVRVRLPDRPENVAVHERLAAAVSAATRPVLGR